MTMPAPPVIFSAQRRMNARARMASIQRRSKDAAQTLHREMALDAIDRIAFVTSRFASAMVLGDTTGKLSAWLEERGTRTTTTDPCGYLADSPVDELQPLPGRPFDLIVSLGLLDTLNDLPGALVLMRRALTPGGLMIASFAGSGSLPGLRAIMLAADATRPAPRIHPQVDVRGAGQLMNRLGFANPVVDGWGFDVKFSSFWQLLHDLRGQASGAVLMNPGASVNKAGLDRALTAFADLADKDGTLQERFEIITLSGWSATEK
ncbi:methyltransferase domain-containing protein [Croceicoccus sp. F390]|uniref:Methyltransferase domain-containing protein n=1 Tax=Croceicoccus esteveae TaxID=3075597 RepID=A0ABU2ZJ29_9SPHN|nr:methyltransferase domain-containing protein [Croceicoccus sp. F390]MDT0576623.1 methyltransferase domain-containing protein [Croceicoccus sp. F390]